MPPLSPQIPPMQSSPRNATASGTARPAAMKRHSSQSSHASKTNVLSPGSAGEHQPLRHPVAGKRHAKMVLPRNHNSARNLAKMGKQAQQNHVRAATVDEEAGRKHNRQRSHEGDTEIRLPGSLDESKPAPPMRRNMTASNLPRTSSHTKLKKNLSHGQLTRLQSGKNLKGLNDGSMRAPPSPGLKPKNRRVRSEDVERDLHEQEVELYRQQQETKDAAAGKKRVGFAVGSAGTESGDGDGEDIPALEGSGLQEDEWTEESASASPYSTRQNTANNSRRASMIADKPPDKDRHAPGHSNVTFHVPESRQGQRDEAATREQKRETEADGSPAPSQEDGSDEEDEAEDEPASPRSQPSLKQPVEQPLEQSKQPIQPPPAPKRSPLHAAKDYYANPATRKLLDQNYKLPAPALVSNVSAMDDTHSLRGSPAPSLRSSRSTVGEQNADEDELVSRFIPSSSHPSTGSGGNTTISTPKQGSFHTPEQDSMLHQAGAKFQVGGLISPGSTISGSSGAATPAHGRSRIELRMLHDKALADREALAERQPLVPHHIYDRRNETLKSYLNLASLASGDAGLTLGPEIFQGRFKAVNTELKVVQKFRDPIGESVARLKQCKGTKLGKRESPQKQAALKMSKSAVSLPARPAGVREASKLSTSASPPKHPQIETSKSVSPQKIAAATARGEGLQTAKSAVQMKTPGSESVAAAATPPLVNGVKSIARPRREVSFAGTPPETREYERVIEELGPDAIARQMWESVGA